MIEEESYEARAISCTDCVWRHHGGVTCDAFPSGIPTAILMGVFDHTNRYQTPDADDQGITRATVNDL